MAVVYPAFCRVWVSSRSGWGKVQPRLTKPVMPQEWAHWPVSRQARLGEQVGLAQKAWRKRTPSSASCWICGVGMAWP